MRALILAFVLGLALAVSAEATPLAPQPAIVELGDASPVQPVRDGCGRGWHRDPLARPMERLALGPLYSGRGSPRRLDRRLEPSLPRLARPLWELG